MSNKEKHIGVEGIDGAGKMTLVNLLNEDLLRKGEKTAVYSYPDYNSSYGKIIRDEFLYGTRKFPVEELILLYLADITKDRQSVLNDLAEGKYVIMDRYYLSTLAYQTAGGFDHLNARKLAETLGLHRPDVVFYLDVDPGISFKRKNKQKENNPDKFERDMKYLNSVRQVYERMISDGYPIGTRWVKIDTNNSTIDDVHKRVLKELRLD